jgi:hypothetical protein
MWEKHFVSYALGFMWIKFGEEDCSKLPLNALSTSLKTRIYAKPFFFDKQYAKPFLEHT